MKYDMLSPPLECIMYNSTCYCSSHSMKVKGIIVHSVKGKKLKRYVQPSKRNSLQGDLIRLLGMNADYTDLNHTPSNFGVHAWIGETADGTITSVQTLPWDYRAWGCGEGVNGSCNDGWIQIAICENDQKKVQIIEELKHLVKYLCQAFDLNPNNYIIINNKKFIPVFLTHQEAYELGYCRIPDYWINTLDFTGFKSSVVNRAGLSLNYPAKDDKVRCLKSKPVYMGPGNGYPHSLMVSENEIVRIVRYKNGFGKLKNRKGWVDLSNTKEVK